MVRPRVARGFVNLAEAVLHQCIRPLIGALGAPGHHGYQRAFELISRQASNGAIWVTSVRMRREDRSSIVVSSSRRPRRVGIWLGHRSFLTSRCSFVRAGGRSFVPAYERKRAARRGRQGRPSCCPDVLLYRCQAAPRRPRARREDQAGPDAISSVLTHSKARPLLRTAQAIRASLLASAIASTLWCNRFLAASIQDLRP